jgi:hypothetical protein
VLDQKSFLHFAQVEYSAFMKSAFELAMSRLEKESPTQKLTDDQRSKLAQIDTEINAKIAERKLFLEGEMRKATGDPAALAQLRQQLSAEVARLEEKRESKKEKIRSAKAE